MGIGKDGKPKDTFMRGMELRAKLTVLAEVPRHLAALASRVGRAITGWVWAVRRELGGRSART